MRRIDEGGKRHDFDQDGADEFQGAGPNNTSLSAEERLCVVQWVAHSKSEEM
jgi:hypothetical protein